MTQSVRNNNVSSIRDDNHSSKDNYEHLKNNPLFNGVDEKVGDNKDNYEHLNNNPFLNGIDEKNRSSSNIDKIPNIVNSRKNALNNARKGSSSSRDNAGGIASKAKDVKEDVEKVAKMAMEVSRASRNPFKAITLAFSLTKEIRIGDDWPYLMAFFAAILKDILDAVFNAFFIGFILSFICGIFIFMMMYLVDAASKRKQANGLVKKGLVLTGGSLADGIPGLGFFPIEAFTVIFLYLWTLYDRKCDKESEPKNTKEDNEDDEN